MYLAGVSVRGVENITEAVWARGCLPARRQHSTRNAAED